MFALTNKPEMAVLLYNTLYDMARASDGRADILKLIQYFAGVLVESYFIFDEPDAAMQASLHKIKSRLVRAGKDKHYDVSALPPAHVLDHQTEKGRYAARLFFEEWLDCEFEFDTLLTDLIHYVFVSWEEQGLQREQAYALLEKSVILAMAFEIAAQELCDVVIERKVTTESWSLGDCIASLSAIAGHRLACSLDSLSCSVFRGMDLPENLDSVVYVMTQEAVRLGVPAGSDWRFGLAANDVPVNAPTDLIIGIEPICEEFFNAITPLTYYQQSVACAKAAGRMIAVTSGGELPDLEPAIAKPLAMAAITETYKSVCMEQKLISV